ncbi:MAG: protein kinase [Myxococcaceae bacterium]
MNAPPAVLGKYQLLRKLAAGGMAEVFLARAAGPMGFEKQVVVKRILPHLADEQNFIAMFLSEARLAAQLNHPNVVQVFDFGEVEGTWYLVMEFIDGINLRLLFRKAIEAKQPLPVTFAARMVSLACEGLAYAHDFADPATGEWMGLVHRDVSPDNILISRSGAVKVVDFGIAKAANQTNLTKTGTVKGKFSYMPPEQLTGQPLDKRADVFALGIVLFELLTGRKPFDTSNEAFIVRAIMYEPMARAAEFRPDIPPAMQAILDKALSKSRDERYADCRELQSDLERFIVQQGEPVSQYQLAQLVQKLVPPAAPVPPPAVTAPPVVAKQEEDVDLSTSVLATPPPQDSVIELLPRVRPPPSSQPPPPPVPTQTMPMPTPAMLKRPEEPVPMLPPAPPPPVAVTLPAPAPLPVPAPRMADLGAISLRDEHSGERVAPMPPPARRSPLPMIAVLVASVGVAAGATWFFTHHDTPAPAPVVTPQPAPEPVVARPPEPGPELAKVDPPPEKPVEPANDPGIAKGEPPPGKDPQPEPVVVAKVETPVEPAPVKDPPKGKKPPKTPKVAPPPVEAKPGPSAPVEFRVRPFGAVWVDGKYLGETPFAPASLSIGAHQVRVVNRDLGKEVTKSIEVKEGSGNVFRHSFEE